LGGKPASEAEKEYYTKKKAAEDLALAKNYEEAIPLFEELHAQDPQDVDVMFYLMLSHGSTEQAPNKKSKAFEFAEKILKSAPESREASKARSYVNSANLNIPDKFSYGADTMATQGGWVMTEEALYKTSADFPIHTSMQARLAPPDQAILWETEASPATSSGSEKLPKGTEVKVLSVKDFIYGLTSWRKPVKADPDNYDTTMFDVSAMYVEVTSEGPLKGKKGWIVNHIDRYLGTEGDAWGSWISNRLKVLREADLATESPKKR
jgi:tetratricopeptide (TPR) repeat protein